MDTYQQIFFWVGIISTAFFGLCGMSVLYGWILNLIWKQFKGGKRMMDMMIAYQSLNKKA